MFCHDYMLSFSFVVLWSVQYYYMQTIVFLQCVYILYVHIIGALTCWNVTLHSFSKTTVAWCFEVTVELRLNPWPSCERKHSCNHHSECLATFPSVSTVHKSFKCHMSSSCSSTHCCLPARLCGICVQGCRCILNSHRVDWLKSLLLKQSPPCLTLNGWGATVITVWVCFPEHLN